MYSEITENELNLLKTMKILAESIDEFKIEDIEKVEEEKDLISFLTSEESYKERSLVNKLLYLNSLRERSSELNNDTENLNLEISELSSLSFRFTKNKKTKLEIDLVLSEGELMIKKPYFLSIIKNDSEMSDKEVFNKIKLTWNVPANTKILILNDCSDIIYVDSGDKNIDLNIPGFNPETDYIQLEE